MQSFFSIKSMSDDGVLTEHGAPQRFSFPGGERHVRVPASVLTCTDPVFRLEARVYCAEGVMDMLLSVDALKRATPPGSIYRLDLPYVPYARQDRVAVAGEPFSAEVMCRLINGLEMDAVVVADPHSQVVVKRLDKVFVEPASFFVAQLRAGALQHVQQLAVVAPDAGARSRAEDVAAAIGAPVVYASKKRDPSTGALSGAQVESDIPDMPLLVVDDICDGGGTFLLLAQALRERTQQPLYLYVTHGLFTKGLQPLLSVFDGVFSAYCADSALADATSLRLAR